MSDPTPTPDAPAPDLEALARDYAGRCGWPMDGTAFRNVHPSDMARALLAFHKEAALRHSNCGAPSGLLSAVLADYLAGRDAAGFLSRQSESKTQRLEAAQKYDHCNQMVERIQAALRAERDEAQPVAPSDEAIEVLVARMTDRAAGKRMLAKSTQNKDAAAFYESHAAEIERDLSTVRALIARAHPPAPSPGAARSVEVGAHQCHDCGCHLPNGGDQCGNCRLLEEDQMFSDREMGG